MYIQGNFEVAKKSALTFRDGGVCCLDRIKQNYLAAKQTNVSTIKIIHAIPAKKDKPVFNAQRLISQNENGFQYLYRFR